MTIKLKSICVNIRSIVLLKYRKLRILVTMDTSEKPRYNTDYLQVVKKHKIRSRQLDVTSHYGYLRATYICQKAFVERRLMFGLETREVSRGIESFARGIRKSKSET